MGHTGAIDEFSACHLWRRETAALPVVEHKGDVKLIALNHLARRLDGKRSRLSHHHGQEQDCYIDDAFHYVFNLQ